MDNKISFQTSLDGQVCQVDEQTLKQNMAERDMQVQQYRELKKRMADAEAEVELTQREDYKRWLKHEV